MIDEDNYVYIKRDNNLYIILFLYVDDNLMTSNNTDFLLTIKYWLSSHFDIKDMRKAEYMLGAKIQ